MIGRVYIAAAFEDHARAALMRDTFQRFDVQVFDWMAEAPAVLSGDVKRTEEELRRVAQEEREAAMAADFLVLLVSENPAHGKGCWFEAGLAHGSGPRWVVAGRGVQPIFTLLAEARFDHDDLAGVYVVEKLRMRAALHGETCAHVPYWTSREAPCLKCGAPTGVSS